MKFSAFDEAAVLRLDGTPVVLNSAYMRPVERAEIHASRGSTALAGADPGGVDDRQAHHEAIGGEGQP